MLVCAQQEQNSTAKKKKPKKVSSSWIWSAKGDRADKEVVYFRKSFEVRGKKAAVLRISCDNHFEAWLNGKLVGKGDDWALPGQFEVRKDLTNGRNVLAILGRNAGGVAALAVSLEVTTAKGEKIQVVTDGSWKMSTKEESGWQQASFDDAKWGKPAVHGKMGMPPWGPILGGAASLVAGEPQEPEEVTGDYKVAKGFSLEKLYTVPKSQGSWVSMAVRPDGRLIVCDQYGGMYGITPPALGDAEATTVAKPLDLAIGGAHGLL